jgi:hypothetical protein
MLASKPGFKYLANEALLKQIDVEKKIKNRGNKSIAGAILSQIGGTLLSTVKIIGSTVGQVAVNGTGTHFLKGFRTDTYLQPLNQEDRSAFAEFFGAGGVEGAQYALRGEEVPGKHNSDLLGRSSQYDYDEYFNTPIPQDGLTRYKAAEGIPIDIAPSGSRIRNTTKAPGGRGIKGSRSNDWRTFSENELNSEQPWDAPRISGPVDTFDPENPTQSPYLIQNQSVNSKNGNVTKEARVRLGDQGAASTNPEYQTARKVNQYWFKSDPNPQSALEVDKINALFPSDGKVLGAGANYEEQVRNGGQTTGRDLIKFRFHIVTPDQPEKVLYFRAFLDAFADNYSGQWNPVKYLGRAEDFQIYGGFQRKISLSFKIAAATRAEMLPLYQKMVWLASATAPTYADGGQFMRGTLTKITVGDYIYELPGVLNSVNYTWNVDYPWEIAMTQPELLGQDDFEQELPMIMDCSIDFTPIHQFTPTTGLRKYITTNLTENNRSGIPGIDDENTGIGVTATPPPAAAPAVREPSTPFTPSGIPFTAVQPYPVFGPQEPEDITIGLPGF